MTNPISTLNDTENVVVFGAKYSQKELLTFGGAGTVLKGTILARKEVATAITPVADVGNTGDGTVAASVASGSEIPKIGSYNLECTFAVTNGRVFKLEDPNGNIVADNLTLRVGAGLVTTFVSAGIAIVVTDGDTDFAAGDKFSIPVVSNSGKLVPYEKDGVGGQQFPRFILRSAVVASGAGDVVVRPIISGEVSINQLVIDSDGDNSNIDKLVMDQLRDYGIIVKKPVRQLLNYDNQ